MSAIDLTGLKGHHPMGFMAACGVLRCCSTTANAVGARLAWERADDGSGWSAVICVNADLTLEQLISILIRKAGEEKHSPAFAWSRNIDDREKFRNLGLSLVNTEDHGRNREALAFVAAFASDVTLNGKGELQPTSFALTSGNQGFLSSIRGLSEKLSSHSVRGRSAISPAECFREALCGPWQYRDEAHSLGWDPQTQRLHALRHRLPEKDKQNRSVQAAVFLAAQSLPLFPCFTAGGRLRTTCFRDTQSGERFTWPIWKLPISLSTLSLLLGQSPSRAMKQRGVEVFYSCRVVRTGEKGNYRVFSWAEEVPIELKTPKAGGRMFAPPVR